MAIKIAATALCSLGRTGGEKKAALFGCSLLRLQCVRRIKEETQKRMSNPINARLGTWCQTKAVSTGPCTACSAGLNVATRL